MTNTNQSVFNYGQFIEANEGNLSINQEGKVNVILQNPRCTIFGRIISKEEKTCEITHLAIKMDNIRENKSTIASEWDEQLVQFSNGVEPEQVAKKREQIAAKQAETELRQTRLNEEKAAREAAKAEKEAERLAKKQQREAEIAAKKAEREAAKAAKEAERQAEKARKEAEKAAKAAAVKATVEAAIVETEETEEQSA
jgi:hypothetical protein